MNQFEGGKLFLDAYLVVTFHLKKADGDNSISLGE
jgi:hypothetical protein